LIGLSVGVPGVPCQPKDVCYHSGVSSLRLAQLPFRKPARIIRVGGARSVRRRLLELGLTPGTEVSVVGVSPLGDPLELSVRGSRLSIRKKEALEIEVTP
jgi:Fe2+ transport system protein FeoA